MKPQNKHFRTVAFHAVKSGLECFLNGKKVIKVRTKQAMDTNGRVVQVKDSELVKVKKS